MSNSTHNGAPGVTTAIDVGSSLSILLVGTAVSSLLVPVGLCMSYFTKPGTMRSPMFLTTIISVVVGLGEGALNLYNQVNTIQHLPVPTAVTTTYTLVHLFLPLVSEIPLMFRIGHERPPRRMRWLWRIFIYGPMFVFKVLRIIVLVSIAVSWLSKSAVLPGPVQGGLDALTAINKLPSQLRWALQTADTLFMATLFFPWPSRTRSKHPAHAGTDTTTTGDCSSTAHPVSHHQSWFKRTKQLFWNAVGSFVFPVLLNLVQFVLVLNQNGVLDFPSIFAANNQAGVIGMVFATMFMPSAAQHPHPDPHLRPQAHASASASSRAGAAAESTTDGSASGANTGAHNPVPGKGATAKTSCARKPGTQRPELARHKSESTLDEKEDRPRAAGVFARLAAAAGLGDATLPVLDYHGVADAVGLGDLEAQFTHGARGMVEDVETRALYEVARARGDVQDGIDDEKGRLQSTVRGGLDEARERAASAVHSRIESMEDDAHSGLGTVEDDAHSRL